MHCGTLPDPQEQMHLNGAQTLTDVDLAGIMRAALRGRAVVARQAHNLKVAGSNPAPAT